MDHTKVHGTSNVYSHMHDGANAEFRFRCQKCTGAGCKKCNNLGHTGTYTYENVPVDVYNKVADAPSVGQAFQAHIKNEFTFTKS